MKIKWIVLNLGTFFFISIIKLIQNNCEMILKNYKNWAVVLNRNCLVTGGWLAGRGQAWGRTSINKFGSMTSRWAFCHFLLSHSSRTLTALIFKRTLRFQTLGGWLILHLRYIIDGICSMTVHTSCSVISSGTSGPVADIPESIYTKNRRHKAMMTNDWLSIPCWSRIRTSRWN